MFLHVEPTDTVLEVKQKLQELVQQVLHILARRSPLLPAYSLNDCSCIGP